MEVKQKQNGGKKMKKQLLILSIALLTIAGVEAAKKQTTLPKKDKKIKNQGSHKKGRHKKRRAGILLEKVPSTIFNEADHSSAMGVIDALRHEPYEGDPYADVKPIDALRHEINK